MMHAESHPGSLTGLSDDRLGTVAVSLVVSDLQWTPDIAPAVMDRISRDAVAYPEQFDRRPRPAAPPRAAAPEPRTAKRTIGRIAVISVILVVVAVLIVVAATANAGHAAILGLHGLDLI